MRKVVIKISQGSVVTQTVLGGLTSSCKFPMLYICQKLWKLAESRQNYCNEHRVQFFWPTLYNVDSRATGRHAHFQYHTKDHSTL